MSDNIKRPGVGVCVFIIHDGKFLIGKRKSAHAYGTFACPGGHLEFMESWENCAIRETHEETGLVVKNPKFVGLTNDFYPDEDKHMITISMLCRYGRGEAKVMEPEKCAEWRWVDLDSLPDNLMSAFSNYLNSEFVDVLKRELAKSKKDDSEMEVK
jgi:ADP-ribose pyrophosphatase